MKHTLCLIFVILFLSGCEKFVGFGYHFYDDNRLSVYCYIPDWDDNSPKDTLINFSKEDLWNLSLCLGEDNVFHGNISYGLGTLDKLYSSWNADTVSFFIFDKDVVDNTPWADVVQNYMVLQRYDFTKADLERIRCQIYYPPTEAMKDIRMWPRYESVRKFSLP